MLKEWFGANLIINKLRNKRVWIVSEVFYPDQTSTAYIMTVIADYLSKYSEVHVLCGPIGYGDILGSSVNLSNLKIHRINAFNLNKNNILLRFIRLAFLSFGMFFFSFFNLRKGDTLLLVTNPALSIPFFSFLRRIRKFRFLILVHDVFPENLIPAKIIRSKTNPIYKFLKLIFDWSYKKADQLFVLGRDMKEVLLHKVKDENKISIIENWADLDNVNVSDFEDNQIIKEHQLQNKIVFLFAGNLGRVQGLDYFFELISSLDNGLLHFLFVGEGTMLSNLMQIKTEKKLDNVSFLGTYPRSKQSLFLNAAHFGVVTLEEEVYGLGVPSKSYNILAAGKPLFFIGNQASEIAQLIKEFSCGVSFGNEQKEETIAFFNKLNLDNIVVYKEMGVVGKKVAECKYSKDMILSKFKKAIINEDS